MANERTIFERLLDPKPDRDRSYASRERRKQALVYSIMRHLRDLLNSRQGCCEILEDYGMPDLESKHDGRIMLAAEMESEIRRMINRYEPRLASVHVRMEQTDELHMTPRFEITARLNVRDDFPKNVSFTTMVDPLGKFNVS